MPSPPEDRDFWNRVAADWRVQVGDDGDSNRILNSDPVLWRFAGYVSGRAVLDAGCGTGYLSQKLHEHGALVTGVDFSERMIALAQEHYPAIDFRVDDCTTLSTLADAQFDLLVSNYVLMDACDLASTVSAFYRVLKPGGCAVLVFSHPCFPQDFVTLSEQTDETSYRWEFNYFEPRRLIGPPWGHFTSEFIWYHRPLSDYWKAFQAAGFHIADFDEPRVTEDRFSLAPSPRKLKNSRTRPYSVAFKLEKPIRS